MTDLRPTSTDWRLCFLCQESDDKKLIRPAAGYEYIAGNIFEFAECGSIPMEIQLERLDEGEGLLQTLRANDAKYHKRCYLKFSEQELNRTRRRVSRALDFGSPRPFPTKTMSLTDVSISSPLPPLQSASETQLSSVPFTDWNLCFLCQDKKNEKKLICPEAGYDYITKHLLEFAEYASIPMGINLQRLDDGSGLLQSLRSHCAKYHKNCYLMVTATQLSRTKKRLGKSPDTDPTVTPSPKKTRSVMDTSPPDPSPSGVFPCFFCEEPDGKLHSVSGPGIDESVRACATRLCDTKLLAKLAISDMQSLKSRYHQKCLQQLYNRDKVLRERLSKELPSDDVAIECNLPASELAIAEMISFILEDSRTKLEPAYKLADLRKMHQMKMNQLDPLLPVTHGTRLKERLLEAVPGLIATTVGREIMLGFNADIAKSLIAKHNAGGDPDAVILAKAANIVRRKMFDKRDPFSGSFTEREVLNSVPSDLEFLIRLILEGPSFSDTKSETQAKPTTANTIGQIIMYNATKTARANIGNSCVRHNAEREMPVVIYNSLKLHCRTRKRELIDKEYKLGLSISYYRMMSLSARLANSVINRYVKEGVVCPANLRKNVFTTAALDNIDHDPSSSTATDSFHGTAISMVSHPTATSPGDERSTVDLLEKSQVSEEIGSLPSSYTYIPDAYIRNKAPTVPKCSSLILADGELNDEFDNFLKGEEAWVSNASKLLEKDDLNAGDMISWAGYHATNDNSEHVRPKAKTALLPLFREAAHTVSMVKHGMELVKTNTDFLNPGQTPVITVDQPLYSLAKQIQWENATLGEDKYVVMLGGLHIEMVVLKLIGRWLEGSGWAEIINDAGITTPGRAEALQTGYNINRSRYAHQITLVVLHRLMRNAYKQEVDDGSVDFVEWCNNQRATNTQFQYWNTVIDLEALLCQFIKSIRTGNFKLYVNALQRIVPWLFTLDHVNYARWLPIHLRDMVMLEDTHPAVYEEFMEGKFVVKKSNRKFSSIALDQAHEQMNKVVKGDGGAIGLFDNDHSLKRWLLSGPEMARLITEFEEIWSVEEDSMLHHEQSLQRQKSFFDDIKRMENVMSGYSNPFLSESDDMMNIYDSSIIDGNDVNTAHSIGESQFKAFWSQTVKMGKEPITKPLKKNNLQIFKGRQVKEPSRAELQVKKLKNRCQLLSHMYVGCHSAKDSGELKIFFEHEQAPEPPSLADSGKMRTCNKADLLPCLEGLASSSPHIQHPKATAKIIDGAPLVHFLQPKASSQNFDDYVEDTFIPYFVKEFNSLDRIDLVWDVYKESSLKHQARNNRGEGIRKRVTGSTKLPSDWRKFLRHDQNKDELFNFLAEKISATDFGEKQLVTTKGNKVLSTNVISTTESIDPCNHEEADTRILLHAAHAAADGHQRIILQTVDTDVVVLGIAAFHHLGVEELWITFGTGNSKRHIAVHDIHKELGKDKASALPFFHALTGCDVTSSFFGRGKKTAWDTWMKSTDVTAIFASLSKLPSLKTTKEAMPAIERFVVGLYSKTLETNEVNNARQMLISCHNRDIDNVPPTRAALYQHLLRAVYQAGYVWGQTLTSVQILPSPSVWGWKKVSDQWTPYWTELPDVRKACNEIRSCGCKTICSKRCGCLKRGGCTARCRCLCKS